METPEVRNPFALLTHPEIVVKAMESSERLGRLHSRICRPLDRQADQPQAAAHDSDGDGDDFPGTSEAAPQD